VSGALLKRCTCPPNGGCTDPCSRKRQVASKRLKSAKQIYRELGARVRRERELICMSQGDFAKMLGYARTSIVNFEAGEQEIPLYQINRMAKILMCPARRLLDGLLYE